MDTGRSPHGLSLWGTFTVLGRKSTPTCTSAMAESRTLNQLVIHSGLRGRRGCNHAEVEGSLWYKKHNRQTASGSNLQVVPQVTAWTTWENDGCWTSLTESMLTASSNLMLVSCRKAHRFLGTSQPQNTCTLCASQRRRVHEMSRCNDMVPFSSHPATLKMLTAPSSHSTLTISKQFCTSDSALLGCGLSSQTPSGIGIQLEASCLQMSTQSLRSPMRMAFKEERFRISGSLTYLCPLSTQACSLALLVRSRLLPRFTIKLRNAVHMSHIHFVKARIPVQLLAITSNSSRPGAHGHANPCPLLDVAPGWRPTLPAGKLTVNPRRCF